MSVSFVQTAQQIIAGAYRICNGLANGQTLSLDQFNAGLLSLNVLLNALMEEDAGIWRMTWGDKPLTASSAVSNGGTYYRCVRSHTSSVDDEPGEGGSSTTYWYEDSSVSDDAVAWEVDTAYTCAGDFVFDTAYSITQAFLRYQDSDYPLCLVTFGEFLEDIDKTDTDIPRILYFDRRNTNRIFLHPLPNDDVVSSGVLHLLYTEHIAEATGVSSDVAIPPSWVRAIKYLLASDIADEQGVPSNKAIRIETKAERLWRKCHQGPHRAMSQVKGIQSCYSTRRRR